MWVHQYWFYEKTRPTVVKINLSKFYSELPECTSVKLTIHTKIQTEKC